MRRAILLFLFVLCLGAMSRDLHAQTVFVSTGSGSQILSVNGQTGAFTVVPQTAEIFDLGFSPEGLVIGPDSKLYITDPNHGVIWRMNQDGSQTEPIYTVQACEAVICPNTVQGPSFSSSSTGDLYFNTEGSGEFFGNGVFAITSVGTTAFGGAINPPVNIAPGTCPTCFTPGDGAGTAFDSANNLLFVEQSGGTNPNSVLSLSPPFTTATAPTSLATGLNNPTGIALNSATGIVYVANTASGTILPVGSTTPYFGAAGGTNNFGSVSSVNCAQTPPGALSPELPLYMQFDGTGHLFVVTAINSFGNCGQLWRIDPPAPGAVAATGTMLLDLSTALANEQVSSNQAIGVALAASNTVTVGPFAVAPGTTVNFIDGTFINQKVAIPPDAIMNGVAFMQMSFIQVAPEVFNSTRLTGVEGNTFSGGNQGPFISPPTTCTVITGTVNNSNCMVMEAKCFDQYMNPLHTCAITAPTTLITLTTSYETPFPQPTPGFLIADDGENNWANILIGYNATAFNVNDPIMVGGTKSCQEDTVIVNLGGPVAPSPASVNFGNVPVFGFPIAVVTVTNTGTAAVTIKSKLAAVPGGDSDDFGALSLCLKPLQPTKSCFILVSFFADPDDFNLQTATLNITNSASGSPQLIVPLTATVVLPKKK
jgi:DNA-binding beta-propeller fold protein YncE